MLRRLIPAAALSLAATAASAQTCPCPPAPTPGWHGSAGAGVALTAGNSETQTWNVNLLFVYDPLERNVVKIDGLYLKASAGDVDTADKSSLGVRDEYRLGRAFLYGDARYQRDRFKELSFLVTPTVGAGYKLVDEENAVLAVDAGLGVAIEKLEDRDATTSGALRAGESFAWRVSDTATVNQLANAVWKLDDFGDAFYHLEAGIVAAVSSRLDLKVAGILDVKNRPASPLLEKADEALLVSLVFKF